MTPKEKASELVTRFIQYVPAEETFELPHAKQCALIAVEEILAEHFGDDSEYGNRRYKYFTEVKSEIEKL